ncbi:MAG: hypothetical protein ACK500_09205 [Flavobacteriales bacterium]|jgi:hypothetical protein
MRSYLCVILISILAVSCADQTPALETNANEGGPNDSLFHVAEGPFNFAIFLPRDMMIVNDSEIRLIPANGELWISIGPSFRLSAIEQESDLKALLESTMHEGIFTNKIVAEDERTIVYQQFLPGGEEWFYQVIGTATLGEVSYTFRSDPMGEYTLEDAQRMATAIRSVFTFDV